MAQARQQNNADVPHADTETSLNELRQRIDEIDERLVELINERAAIVVEIGKLKRNGGGPIYAPDREQRVLEHVRQCNRGPLPNHCLEAMWRELMSGSFALERPLRVGYLGPAGSFSHLAARKKFGASVEYDNLENIASVFDEIDRGNVDYGLVPIENSAIGGIGETLDGFLKSNVQVCAEVLVTIHHDLLSNSPLDQIKRIYSKPEALGQCRKWLSSQLIGAERVAAASTSRAAELAANEPGAAAIGSSLAGEVYGLKTLSAHIEDDPHNTTRFFVISKQTANPTGDDKTSIMFTTEHKPGTLVAVLDVLRDYGLNLTHIDKRPSRQVNWEYYFFVDMEGHMSDPDLAEGLAEARKHCLQLTVLGSFPRAREVL